MLFCMSRRKAGGQELVPSEEGRCQGHGSGEQLWPLWALTWMTRCCHKFAGGQQKWSAPKPKGAWALPAACEKPGSCAGAAIQAGSAKKPGTSKGSKSCVPAGYRTQQWKSKKTPPGIGESRNRQLIPLTSDRYRQLSSPGVVAAQAIFSFSAYSWGAVHSCKPFPVVCLPTPPCHGIVIMIILVSLSKSTVPFQQGVSRALPPLTHSCWCPGLPYDQIPRSRQESSWSLRMFVTHIRALTSSLHCPGVNVPSFPRDAPCKHFSSSKSNQVLYIRAAWCLWV